MLADEVINDQAKQERQGAIKSLTTQLESISATANELLAAAGSTISPSNKPVTKSVRAEQPKPADTDAKLSDYYGVSQINDAVAFVTLYPRAESVQVAGDFNNWQPTKTPMEKVGESGVWQTKIKLPAGTYRYRLVVDGQWQQDPYNERTELNPFGGHNSVLEVK